MGFMTSPTLEEIARKQLLKYRDAAAAIPVMIEQADRANMTVTAMGVVVVMESGEEIDYSPGSRPAGKVAGCYAFVGFMKGGSRFDFSN